MRTPWGTAQHVTQLADGVCFVSTASHGGFKLSAERNAKVPKAWREGSFGGQGLQGWYEEDCDVALVMLTFPELFEAEVTERARKSFGSWFPTLSMPA